MLAVAELTFHPNGNPYKFTYSLVPSQMTTNIESNSLSSTHFNLFPNPANEQLHFVPSTEFSSSVFEIRIFNAVGEETLKTSSSSADGTNINISKLSPGLYFVEAISQKEQLGSRRAFTVVR